MAIVRTELKEIDPPKDVQETMNKVVKAENEKVAALDFANATERQADGVKRAEIKKAEGIKQAKILSASDSGIGRPDIIAATIIELASVLTWLSLDLQTV